MNFRMFLFMVYVFIAFTLTDLNAAIISLPGELGDGIAVAALVTCIFIPQSMPYTNRYPDTSVCVDNGWLDEALRQDLYGDESSLGWGIEFEKAINETFSARFRQGLVIKNFYTNNENMYITAEDFMLDYYFDHQGLHGLNLGFGFGYANVVSTLNSDQTVILNFGIEYTQILIGYKFNYGLFMLEPYFDLMIPLSDTYQSQTRIIQLCVSMIGLNIGAAF